MHRLLTALLVWLALSLPTLAGAGPLGTAAPETRAPTGDELAQMQRGAVLAEGSYAEVSGNPAVMEAYMGTTEGQLQGAH